MTRFVRPADHDWRATGIAGVEKTVLWRSSHGMMSELFRLKKDAPYPPHPNRGWEQMRVIAGRIRSGGQELGPGEFVFTEPGEHNALKILEESLVLLSFGPAS